MEVVWGDVRDAEAVERAVAGCDIVYHLAGLRARDRAPRELLAAVNVGGTENIARAVLRSGVGRLVLAPEPGHTALSAIRLSLRGPSSSRILPTPDRGYWPSGS